MTDAIEIRESGAVVRSETMSLKQVTDRVNMVHQILEKVMQKNTHYGTVPGCGSKMVLLKPGADVLAMTFRLVPQFKVERTDLGGGHREFDVTCSMFGPDGSLLGQGVGSASTMEGKYRYRKHYCPEGDKKDSYGKTFKRIENEDIADVYNTVLKIAKKRAHIDATLTVTGAADLFTQDLIENEDEPQKPEIKMPTEKPKESAKAAAPESDEDLMAEITLGEVKTKTGKSTKGEWTRYYTQASDGEFYSTFSDTLGGVMQEMSGQPVRMKYKIETTAKGESRTVVDIDNAAPDDEEL